MKRLTCVLSGCVLGAAVVHAGPRTSAAYSVAAEITDGGGRRSTSASYTNDGSAGGVVGISTSAPAQTAKAGYVGQFYDVTGLALNAAPLSVDEGATLQLSAWQVLDDATFLTVPPSGVT